MGRILALGVIAACAAAVLIGAASGDRRTPAPTAPKAAATKLTLKRSPFGRVLFADGYAMYAFTRDRGSRSQCHGNCARAWPPLEAGGEVKVGEGVKRRLLGTTKRPNGSEQVTYRGRPLYGYVDDPRGEVLCHDVEEFGGTWLALRRTGRPAP